MLCRSLFAIGLLFAIPLGASAQERHALVIGTAQYERARDLANPGHDARDVASRLADLGFVVHGDEAQIDLTREAMLGAIRDFSANLPDGALVVVFLAGHGLAHGGNTYLVPSNDSGLISRDDLDAHAVALRALTGRLAARAGADSLVIVDACSANGLRGDGPGAGGAGDVVASMDGSLSLFYAAAPGQIAADGEGRNSPFTSALLKALEAPNRPLDTLFADVAARMASGSQGTQTPWVARTFGQGEPVFLISR